jgi:hypothetical protein
VTAKPADLLASIRVAWGFSRLTLADLALEQDIPDVNGALGMLQNFEADFGGKGFADVLSKGLAKRILALVAAGRLDEAAATAKKFSDQYPDAAAAVIEGLLQQIEEQADKLRFTAERITVDVDRRKMLERVAKMYAAAESFGETFVKWAEARKVVENGVEKPKFSDEDLLPYRVSLAKVKRLAGKPQEAVPALQALAAKFGNRADVLHQLAEAYYALAAQGDATLLAEADKLYVKLTNDLKPGADNQYPALWWNAWMRRLQILDRQGRGAQIPGLVEQLRRLDDKLGGEPYRSEFARLERNIKFGT